MSSRLFFGSRSAKHKAKEAQPTREDKASKGSHPLPTASQNPKPSERHTRLPLFSSSKSSKSERAALPDKPTGTGKLKETRAGPPENRTVQRSTADGQNVSKTPAASSSKPLPAVRRIDKDQAKRSNVSSPPSQPHPTSMAKVQKLAAPTTSAPSKAVSLPESYNDPFPGAILGISMPTVSSSTSQVPSRRAESNTRRAAVQTTTTPPPQTLTTHDLPPQTPFTVQSSSASTRYSESPSPWSRTTTPTSVSSASPGNLLAPRSVPGLKKTASPGESRPPVALRRHPGTAQDPNLGQSDGLEALKESQNPGSQTTNDSRLEKGGRKPPTSSKIRVRDAPAPTPPLRTSSKRLPKPSASPAHTTQNREGLDSKTQPASLPTQSSTLRPRDVSESMLPKFNTKTPPPRPSREGTPVLDSWKTQEPAIIQSNLDHLETTGHKRRESVERAQLINPKTDDVRSGPAKLTKTPPTLNAKQTSRSAGTQRASITSSHLYKNDAGQESDMSIRSDLQSDASRPGEHVVGTTTSKHSNSRFGLFSKRSKTTTENVDSQHERVARKGPAAGTGHEGYGRYARRGRTASIGQGAGRGRSTSSGQASGVGSRPATSRKSSFNSNHEKPELDDFFKDRLAPVVISGGGVVKENRNSVTSAAYSSAESLSSTAPDYAPRMYPTDRPRAPTSVASSNASSTMDVRTQMPPPRIATPGLGLTLSGQPRTLAHRRSLHRAQLTGQPEAMSVPAPINTHDLSTSLALDSRDTYQSSIPATDGSMFSDGSELQEVEWLKSKKANRVKLPKKWNIFSRSRSTDMEESIHPVQQASRQLQAAVTRVPDSRSKAFYAMLDGSEQEDTDDLETILREVEDDLELRNDEGEIVVSTAEEDVPGRQYSLLLPSPPKFANRFADLPRVPSQKSHFYDEEQETPQPDPRTREGSDPYKPRLKQVGRIPRVVSRRDHLHRPAPQSFSRPFQSRPSLDSSVPESPVPETFGAAELPAGFNDTQEAPLPTSNVRSDPLPSAPFPGFPPRTANERSINRTPYNLDGEREFLSFSPRRQGSEVSTTSSSVVPPFAAMTALPVRADAPAHEDEIWNEYDELLEDVGIPFILSPVGQEILNAFPSLSNLRRDSSQDDPANSGSNAPVDTPLRNTPRQTSPKKRKNKPTLPEKPKHVEFPVLLEGLPSTPRILSGIYGGYEDTPGSSAKRPQVQRASSRYSNQSTQFSSHSTDSSRTSSVAKRATLVIANKMALTEPSNNLRFSALMTSRWLSFDRVLFSPIVDEIQASRQDRVLVLDGLGNDDWSAYCALTYPEATVYHLSSIRPLSKSSSLRSRTSANSGKGHAWVPPSNLRHISHPSLSHPFPFPKAFFTAVVLRFPSAASENALKNTVSECRRVLRPGGYLELTILDMDMLNMGHRTRMALRETKVKMQAADDDVCLSPASDVLLKLMGRRGFEGLRSCAVSLPVVGSIFDDEESENAGSAVQNTLPVPNSANLMEMLRTSAVQPDFPVAKMMDQVGRWWWSRCYEHEVNDAEESIWNETALLKECEKRGTGLRLMIAHAQKPAQTRRRTVSL